MRYTLYLLLRLLLSKRHHARSRNDPHNSQRNSTAHTQVPQLNSSSTMALSANSTTSTAQPTKPTQSEASVVIVTCGDSISKADDVHKLSTWRKLKTHLRRRRASRQIDDTSSRLEKTESKKKKEKKKTRVAIFFRAFLDAACPPLPIPAPPGPETFVRMPFAYRQKDHPGVLVAGRRVPFSIHMHLGRKSEVCSTLEAISEEEQC